MPKRSFSGISASHSSVVKRRKAMGGFASQINRKSSTKSLAAKVNQILAGEEKKNHDVTGTVTTTGGTPSVTTLSAIPQGDTATTRDGRKVMIKTVQGKYHISATNAGAWRVIVLMDHNALGAAGFNTADLLEVATNPQSPLNLAYPKRFTILHDNYCGNWQGSEGASWKGHSTNSVGAYSYYTKVEQPIDWQVTPTTTDFGDAMLYMVTLSTGVIANAHYTRVRFTDS